jgi:hypothetical protein
VFTCKEPTLSKAAFFLVVFETNGARVVFAVLGRACEGCGRRVYAGRVRVYAGLVRVEAGVGVGGCGCAVRGGVCGCAVAGVGGSCGRVWLVVGGWVWVYVGDCARACAGVRGSVWCVRYTERSLSRCPQTGRVVPTDPLAGARYMKTSRYAVARAQCQSGDLSCPFPCREPREQETQSTQPFYRWAQMS